MDEFRYFLGLVLILIMPVVITFWVVIHGGSKQWRKRSPEMAYSFAGFFILVVILLAWSYRISLLGADLGFNLLLFVMGTLIYIASFVLWKPVKKHLDFKTFAGVPEVTDQKIELIQDGPFAIVRHPRYLMVAIGVAGWCLMSNYAGAYLIGLLSIAGLFLIVWLEERDLVMRFGDEYRAYQKKAPQLIPTISGMKKFWTENFRSSNQDSD
jgi:protein-S-isoprenylcysteine O-methyltransferase Ste14